MSYGIMIYEKVKIIEPSLNKKRDSDGERKRSDVSQTGQHLQGS
jgi:hypothetical protein